VFYFLVVTISTAFANDIEHEFYINDIADSYIAAEENNDFYQLLAASSIELAYLIQAKFIQKKAKSITGYKIGLSSVAAQTKFKHHSPVFGVLLQPPVKNNEFIRYTPVKKLLEVELGFQMNTSITTLGQLDQPIENLVSAVMPVIEVPTINFENINTITAFDIIATNVGAATFIVGKSFDINTVDVNNIWIELCYEDQVVMQGFSNSPLNNQFDALAWVVRQALLQGYEVDKGHIVLTGSILKPTFISPGKYKAKFGGLQNINLHVK
jgi:2-oxo-hept-3-ene-1,7-dioate hydratase